MVRTKIEIRSIEYITNLIVETDNFLLDLQDTSAVIDQAKLVRRRAELNAVLKFFNAEG